MPVSALCTRHFFLNLNKFIVLALIARSCEIDHLSLCNAWSHRMKNLLNCYLMLHAGNDLNG